MGSISRQKLKKRKEKNVAFFKRRKKNGTFWTEKNAVPNPALNVLESLLQCFYCTILLHSVHLSDKYQPIHKVFLLSLSLSPFICPSPFSSSFSLISYLLYSMYRKNCCHAFHTYKHPHHAGFWAHIFHHQSQPWILLLPEILTA